MDTARKLIADVHNSLRAISLDDRYSNRHILSTLTDKAKVLFRQDADGRTVFKISEVWKRIPCLELCPVDIIECCVDLPTCKLLMKSRLKVPEVFQSKYGNALKVMNLDASKEFVQTTFHGYKDIQNREYKDPNIKYFILSEGHVFIPDSEVEQVQLFGLFKNPFEVTKLVEENADCLKPLDEPIPVPDYYLDIIKRQVFEELARGKGIPKDEKGNLNSNEK